MTGVRAVAIILGALALGALARQGAQERACRLSFEGLNEYAVLAEACKDPAARESLLRGAP